MRRIISGVSVGVVDIKSCLKYLTHVCVYYCSTYCKAVRLGEGDSGGHVLVTRDDDPRPVWTSHARVRDSGGHVLRETTSRGSGVCLGSRRSVCLLLQYLIYKAVRVIFSIAVD
jgi:hypothetical protein